MDIVNVIYNQDCFDTMSMMSENNYKVDCVLTSPPYNMTERKGGYADSGRYDVYEDWKSEKEYIDWTVNLFNNIDKILKKDRAILYNFSYSIENPSLPYKMVAEIVTNTPFTLIDTIIWKKRCAIPFPANGKRLTRICEFVFVFVRKDEVDTYENNRKVLSISKETGQKYYETELNFVEADNNDGKCEFNQATYSSELCTKLMNIYVRDGWTVYDPFMGSGTTAAACTIRGDVNYVGSEISANQCEFARKRIEGLKSMSIKLF